MNPWVALAIAAVGLLGSSLSLAAAYRLRCYPGNLLTTVWLGACVGVVMSIQLAVTAIRDLM